MLKKPKRQGEEPIPKPNSNPGPTAADLRLEGEFRDLDDLPSNVQIKRIIDNDPKNFWVMFDLTKEDSLWKGGKYKFTVTVENEYPHKPPKVHCDTPVYHPNIDTEGNVCLNILRKDWSAVLGVRSVIMGLQFLFIDPNPNDPLN